MFGAMVCLYTFAALAPLAPKLAVLPKGGMLHFFGHTPIPIDWHKENL